MPLRPSRGLRLQAPSLILLILQPGCRGGVGSVHSAPSLSNPGPVGQHSAPGMANHPPPQTQTSGIPSTQTWANAGHAVDWGAGGSLDNAYRSGGAQAEGFAMTHRLMTAGTYHYCCTTHCDTCTVVVQSSN